MIPTLLLRRKVVVSLHGPSNPSGEHVKLRPESTSPQEGEEKPQGVVVAVVVVGGGDDYLLSAGAGCSHMLETAKRAVKSEGWTGCWRGGGAG